MDSDIWTPQHVVDAEARAAIAAKAAELERAIDGWGFDVHRSWIDWQATLPALMDCKFRRSRGFIVRGGTGSGKTTFLRALVSAFRSAGAHYIDCARIADAEYLDWPDTASHLAANAFVLLDDFGTDEIVQAYGNRIDRVARLILDWSDWPQRYGPRSAMLVVATNLTGEQVAQRYGARVASRLSDLRPVVWHAADARGWQRHAEVP